MAARGPTCRRRQRPTTWWIRIVSFFSSHPYRRCISQSPAKQSNNTNSFWFSFFQICLGLFSICCVADRLLLLILFSVPCTGSKECWGLSTGAAGAAMRWGWAAAIWSGRVVDWQWRRRCCPVRQREERGKVLKWPGVRATAGGSLYVFLVSEEGGDPRWFLLAATCGVMAWSWGRCAGEPVCLTESERENGSWPSPLSALVISLRLAFPRLREEAAGEAARGEEDGGAPLSCFDLLVF